MSGINDKLINYGGLSTFYDDLKQNDLAAKQDVLSAGDNISIESGKINADGYKSGKSLTSSFTEIPEIVVEAFIDMTSMIGSTDLYFTGAAGATTYTVSGNLVAMLSRMFVGLAFQVGNSEMATCTAFDSTDSVVTLDKSLDAENALSNAQVSKIYMPVTASFSGDANATTYSYVSSPQAPLTGVVEAGMGIKIGDYPIAKVVSITSNTITLDSTLDVENAVSGAPFNYAIRTNNVASGWSSHAEGGDTTASGMASHAEGNNTTASGWASHTEGNSTSASGEGSHAEGARTTASGRYGAHAEGESTVASGNSAHSEGWGTTAQNWAEHSEGKYNTSHKASDTYGNAGNTTHSVGIGIASSSRKNAFEIMQNGDMYVLGVGGYQGTDTHVQDSNIDTLQSYLSGMANYIQGLEARIYALEHPQTVE